jgi:RNA polymerase primary sigma factor
LGLIKAAKRFDETRGFKFISYAVWWIRQSILQALAEQSRIVRLPLNKIGSINKINKMYAFLEQANERVPSAEEIAKELDMTVSDVKESMKNSGRHVSMDAPLVEGEDSNLYDVLKSGESPNPDKGLLHESLQTEIERALETLTPREADVVRLYFGLGEQHAMTLEEIGETFDLTRERVRQIKEKAIRRLKHTSRSKILKTYLG